MLSCSVLLLALFASVQGRAVNISNTWVLPEEGFPVFYRYFRDRISWYEADAVCQFHHANLVTVDTTAQYDAVRAYLKELDISSAVWVGLIRSNPDGDFTWTDYRGLSGDGYWSAAPDARAAPLCAAADPAADYRWEARACGGPTVASFICELPVPQWALGSEGCMVRALPALTILYLPESAAVQLTADCGLAGVKRVQCTGNVRRENLLKDLSCTDENESTTTPIIATEESSTSSTDLAINTTDIDTGSELTTEDEVVTKYTSETSSFETTQATPIPIVINEKVSKKQPVIINKLDNIYTQKNINLDLLHNNNLQSNDIPKLANNENFLTIEQSEKLEDEKHMHHKMLHDELARNGNFETIFTQPTDHFVPPLVMAKAKISDDMTVLSLAEKHAQQLAEQHRSAKHKILNEYSYLKTFIKSTTEEPHKIDLDDKPLVTTLQPPSMKESIKKDKIKSGLPKKYKDKRNDPKTKNLKTDDKLLKIEKTTEKFSAPIDVITRLSEVSTTPFVETSKTKSEDDSLELTVILKEPKTTINKQFDDIAKFENIAATQTPLTTVKEPQVSTTIVNKSVTKTQHTTEGVVPETTKLSFENVTDVTEKQEIVNSTSITTTEKPATVFPIKTDTIMQDLAMNHEVIKITIVDENDKSNPTHTVFEVTTLVPVFKDDVNNNNELGKTSVADAVTINKETVPIINVTTYSSHIGTIENETVITTETTLNPFTLSTKSGTSSSEEIKFVSTELPLTTKTDILTSTNAHVNETINSGKHNTESLPTANIPQTTDKEKMEVLNITEMYEIDSERNLTDPDAIDDYNSPLLSAANEPLHRPNRSRRPQPPNRLTKFNPFRILG